MIKGPRQSIHPLSVPLLHQMTKFILKNEDKHFNDNFLIVMHTIT